MNLDTRITFNNLSTKARADVKRGYFFIKKGDTAPSLGDTITHEGEGYEVVSVDRLDATAGTRRIRVRLLNWQKPKPEPLADWEREILYGTTGPMPTPEIIKTVLQRGAGREVLAQIGVKSDRHLKSLLGHAIVLAKQEMAEHHKREAAKANRDAKHEALIEEGNRVHADLAEAVGKALTTVAPKVEEHKPARPDAATTLEAASFYIERGEWAGRFERLLRGFRKPLTPQSQLSMGGMVDPHSIPMASRIR